MTWIDDLADLVIAERRLTPKNLPSRYSKEEHNVTVRFLEKRDLDVYIKSLTADQKQELAEQIRGHGFLISTTNQVLRGLHIDANRHEACGFAELGAVVGLVTVLWRKLLHQRYLQEQSSALRSEEEEFRVAEGR